MPLQAYNKSFLHFKTKNPIFSIGFLVLLLSMPLYQHFHHFIQLIAFGFEQH